MTKKHNWFDIPKGLRPPQGHVTNGNLVFSFPPTRICRDCKIKEYQLDDKTWVEFK